MILDQRGMGSVEVVNRNGARSGVVLTHAGFARRGEGWDACRDGMGGPRGWPWLL